MVATTEALATLRALELSNTPEYEAALVWLGTGRPLVDYELSMRQAYSLRDTAFALTVPVFTTHADGFIADEPYLLAQSLATQPATLNGPWLTRAQALAGRLDADGCLSWVHQERSAHVTATAALALAQGNFAPAVIDARSRLLSCLASLPHSSGDFGGPAATALTVLALEGSAADVSTQLNAGRAYLLATQQPNGSWGSVYATALALRALALSGPDWRIRTDELGRAAIALSNPEPLAGEPVLARLEVENTASRDAPPVTLRYTAEPVGTGPALVLAEVTVPALAARQRTTVDVTLPTSQLRGRYVLRARVDALQVVPERNELDNDAAVSLNVRNQLDLALASGAIRFAQTGANQVTISVDVRVLGGTLTSPARVDVYRGTGAAAALIGSATVAAGVPPNGIATASVSWSTSGLNGPSSIIAVVDADNAVAEADENNNRTTRYYFAPTGRPVDVSIVSSDIAATAATAGDLSHVEAVVRNLSAADALNVPVEIQTGNGVQLAATELASVPAFSSAIAAFDVRLANAATLVLAVDPGQLINDTNRVNNTTFFNVAVPARANLIVSQLSLSTLPQAVGDRYDVLVSLTGQASPPVVASIEATNPRTGETLYRGNVGFPSTSVRLSGLLADSTMPQLTVCIDVANAIEESNENDNCLTETFSQQAIDRTNLTVSSRALRSSPVGPEVGELVSVEADVLNKSTVASGGVVEWFLGRPTSPEGRKVGESSFGSVPAGGTAVARYQFVMPAGAVPELHARIVRTDRQNVASLERTAGRHLYLEAIVDLGADGYTFVEGRQLRVATLAAGEAPTLLIGLTRYNAVGPRHGVLQALQRSPIATYQRRFNIEWFAQVIDDVAVADLDRDGTPEIIAMVHDSVASLARGLEVIAYRPDGSRKWGTRLDVETAGNDAMGGTMALSDINRDGITDIQVTDQGELVALSGADGSLLRRARYGTEAFYDGTLQLEALDVEGDGTSETLVWTRDNTHPTTEAILLNGDGGVRWRRRITVNGGKPAIADLDQDGRADAVYQQYQGQLEAISLFDGQRQNLSTTFFGFLHGVSVSPARQDGLPYAVASTFGAVSPELTGLSSRLSAYRGDLSPLWSTPILRSEEYGSSLTTMMMTSADLLGQGRPQLVGMSAMQAFTLYDARSGQALLQEPSPDRPPNIPSRYVNTSLDYPSPVVAELSDAGTAFVIAPYFGSTNAAGAGQPTYGHAEALVFHSPKWHQQPAFWPTSYYAKGRVRDDFSVDDTYQWWRTHNTWNAQFTNEPARLLPDLIALAPSPVPQPTHGEATTLQAQVRNVGGLPASDIEVSFYDGAPDAGGRFVGTATVAGPLAVRGGTAVASVPWLATAEGEHDIHVIANPSGQLEESGLENNEGHYRLFVAAATVGCDLEVVAAGATVAPSPAVAGDTLTATATVRNLGQGGCSASQLTVFEGPPSGNLSRAVAAIPALAASAQTAVSVSFASVSGSYVFHLMADATSELADVNPANNVATVTHATAVGELPELYVAGVALSPQPALPTESVAVTVRVRNVGAPVGVTRLELRSGASVHTQAEVPPLLVGEEASLELKLTAGASTETLTAVVDSAGAALEVDEANNARDFVLQVQSSLLEANSSVSPNTVGPFTSVQSAVTLSTPVAPARDVLVTTRVERADGAVVATLRDGVRAVVPQAGAVSLPPVGWSSGATLAGDYVVRTSVTEGGRPVAQTQAPLTIVAGAPLAAAAISADRGRYVPGETAVLSFAIDNLSGNATLDAAEATLTVSDPHGVPLFVEVRQLPTLLPMGRHVGVTAFDLSPSAVAGAYAVTLQLTRGGQTLALAVATLDVQVQATRLVTGVLTVPATFQVGVNLPLSVLLDNRSSQALSNEWLAVELYDAEGSGLVPAASTAISASLAAQASGSFDFTLPTAALTPGKKLVVVRLGARVIDRALIEAIPLIDLEPPAIAIDGVYDLQLTNQDLTPTISVTDAHAFVSTSTLDGAPFVSGTTVSIEGEHVLTVEAVDEYGNSAWRQLRFTIDKTPPALTVSGVTDGALLNQAVVLSYAATDAHGVTVTSTLNGLPLGSGDIVSADGDYVWLVTATDGAGNVTTEQRAFSLDFAAPVITINGVSEGAVVGSAVSLTYFAVDAHLTSVTALLDGAPYVSGTAIASEGPHQLVVTALDAAGNVASAARSFSLDFTAPVISLSGVVDGAVTVGPVVPVFSATDEHLSSLTATLNGAPVPSGSTITAEGDYVLEVTAVDQAGNRARTLVSFAIDVTRPVVFVTIVSSGAFFSVPVQPAYSAVDLHLSSAFATLDGAPYASGSVISSEGLHVLVVQAADAAGNASTVTVPFTLDFTAPVLTVSGVTEGASAPSFTPTATATDASPVTVSLSLDGVPFISGGTVSQPGAHTLIAVARDAAGNVSTQTMHFTVTASTCGSTTLVARRDYQPSRWSDARACFAGPFRFRLPSVLPVSKGNAGNHLAYLVFTRAQVTETCTYRGASPRAHPVRPAEVTAGREYRFVCCSNGAAPGELLEAERLRLHVHDGDQKLGSTEVTLRLDEVAPCGSGVNTGCGSQPPPSKHEGHGPGCGNGHDDDADSDSDSDSDERTRH